MATLFCPHLSIRVSRGFGPDNPDRGGTNLPVCGRLRRACVPAPKQVWGLLRCRVTSGGATSGGRAVLRLGGREGQQLGPLRGLALLAVVFRFGLVRERIDAPEHAPARRGLD